MNRKSFCAIVPFAACGAPKPPAGTPRANSCYSITTGDSFPVIRRGAESPTYDAACWRTLDLPHDWSIEGTIDPKDPMGGSGGYFPAGVGRRRRTFTVSDAWRAKRVSVESEGIYMTVYINGHELGVHPYG